MAPEGGLWFANLRTMVLESLEHLCIALLGQLECILSWVAEEASEAVVYQTGASPKFAGLSYESIARSLLVEPDCRAVVLKAEHGSLSETEQGDVHMNELTPFNMALRPKDHTLVVGLGSAGLKVLEIAQQATGPPTLSFAPGVSRSSQCTTANNVLCNPYMLHRTMRCHCHICSRAWHRCTWLYM